ncbi:MAG: DegT/DnrJ/EryC1/StrS family aminotransferase [Rhodospirillaceae bacterium]|nr:DegT/DnrJ/EryC1/StrS family aminotransferase [Rhodospirillaceae bacterium]
MKLINDLGRHTAAHKDEIAAAVAKVIESGWFVLGPETAAFEQEFAAYCSVSACVGVANGTEALELALRALGVGAGDRVAGVANAGGYGLHAMRAIGALPSYVDVDDTSLNMSPELLDRLLKSDGRAIRAVIFTHLYGNTAGLEAVAQVCARHGAPLVEDCAQAHGAVVAGKKVGSWGVLGCFSFYPTKNLGALGDGGAVVTADEGLAGRLRQLRQYGWGKSKYVSELPGARNSRLDEIQSAVLRVKLRHLDGWNARRRVIAQRYAQGLAGLPVRVPLDHTAAADPGYVAHLYVLRTPRRDALRAHLKNQGIGTDIHYPVPDHKQPSCPSESAITPLPVSENLAIEVLTLPCYPELADIEVDAVTGAVHAWARAG